MDSRIRKDIALATLTVVVAGAMIDENTALVLHGSNADVLGVGSVALVDPAKDKANPYLVLKAGDLRDVSR